MTVCLRLVIYFFLIVIPVYGAHAQENVELDSYSCADFLKDAKEPADGARLLRSLMMIAWATGYAAAHQEGAPRADVKAVQLIAATLGDACRKTPTKSAVHTIEDTVNQFAKTKIQNTAAAAPPSNIQTSSPSRWKLNGSIAYLVSDGALRRFYFETPLDELAAAGAKKGMVLFDGKKAGNHYSGTAYTFAARCQPVPYQVNGEVSTDEKQVTLHGAAPEINSSSCSVKGHHDDVLVFTFIPSEENK
jgi:hypothetical protein